MRISTLAPAALLLSLFALPVNAADLSALSGAWAPNWVAAIPATARSNLQTCKPRSMSPKPKRTS